MGCTYRELHEPFTSIQVNTVGLHTKICLWANGKLAGRLVMDQSEALDFLDCLRGREIAHTSWGGDEKGTRVRILGSLPRSTQLISEYGDIVTMDKVLKMDGEGKK